MSEVEELKNRLFYKRENAWEDKTGEQLNNIFAYAEGYINFLNKSKTEREIVANAKEIAESNGFRCICEYETLSVGDKVYYINRQTRHGKWYKYCRSSCGFSKIGLKAKSII